MNILNLVAAAALGYLLGSIPFGYLVGSLWGVDVREEGSGRTGGTNVWRATHRTIPVALTLFGDTFKGVAAVLIARNFLEPPEATAALAGAAAVLGHIWPLFLNFNGGAGGSTAAITWIALNPVVGIPNLIYALFVFAFGRYASLATLTVGVSGVILAVLLLIVRPDLVGIWDVVFGLIVTIAMVITLQPNLRRLRQGSERRIDLW
ncbi:MAG: glycerol-3-phosphate acyltransferase [Chloroflexota bacterium]|nr:glycerol-3-phosphate acyltransferase [Chloroflexota bacterium]